MLCLNDSSEKVRNLASLFFTELSKRSNNPVYNLLGDVISFLSRAEGDVSLLTDSSSGSRAIATTAAAAPKLRTLSQAEFQSTMTFLLSFVKKDKWVNLVFHDCCLYSMYSFLVLLLIIFFSDKRTICWRDSCSEWV